jgi:aerobic carbon-monoxide dehydrogenase large subunit
LTLRDLLFASPDVEHKLALSTDAPELMTYDHEMSDNLAGSRFLDGSGAYLGDLENEDALHGVFVRSPFAHGHITELDTAAARAANGVIGVWTAADLDLRPIPGDLRTPDVPTNMSRPPLAGDVSRYSGEPVALVVATNLAQATDAAELVYVDMDTLPVVIDVRSARQDVTVLFPDVGTNVAVRKHTKQGEMPMDAAVSVTLDLFHPLLAPTPIEPLGFIALPQTDPMTVWCSHQMPHRLRRELALCLGLEEKDLRVRVPDVGGAFGQKGQLNAEYVVIAAVARELGRPVRWIQTRRENLTVGPHGRGSRTKITMRGDRDGRIRGLEVEILADAGAYPHSSAFVPLSTHLMAPGPYRFDAVDITTTIVTTNTTPTGPYRGAGRPEAAYGLERAVEAFARRVDLDVTEVRRTNLVRAADMPYTTQTGAIYDSGDYSQALDILMELMGYESKRLEQLERRERSGVLMGIGLSIFLDRTGGSSLTLGEYGSSEVTPEGKVILRTGSTDSGQGHWPIWRRLAAEALDVPADSIELMTGDTETVPDGTGSFGSRSSQAGASSIHRTATRVRAQALDVAARLLEIHPGDLEGDGAGGFFVKGNPTSSISLAQVAQAASDEGSRLFADEYFRPGAHTFPHAAHGAVVVVDPETGSVKLEEYFAVDDCGRILDPTIVEGQVHGSIVQGIGQALYEQFLYDDSGQPLTGSLTTYSLPHATDIPPLQTAHTESPSPTNPLGTKGVGESGTIGAPAAVINAIVDALGHLGVEDISLPASPFNVWRAIQATSHAHQPSRGQASADPGPDRAIHQ